MKLGFLKILVITSFVMFYVNSRKSKIKKKRRDENNAGPPGILTFKEIGENYCTIKSDEPKLFISNEVLPETFTIDVKIDKLKKGGLIYIGLYLHDKIEGDPLEDETNEQWFVSSFPSLDEGKTNSENPRINEADLVRIFASKNNVNYQIIHQGNVVDPQNYSYIIKKRQARLAVKLFSKDDKAIVQSYTNKEGQLNSTKPSTTPSEWIKKGDQIINSKAGDSNDQLEQGPKKSNGNEGNNKKINGNMK